MTAAARAAQEQLNSEFFPSTKIITFVDTQDRLQKRDQQDREFFNYARAELSNVKSFVKDFEDIKDNLASHIDYNALMSLASRTSKHHKLSRAEQRVLLRRYAGFKGIRSSFRSATYVKTSHTLDLGKLHHFLSVYTRELSARVESLQLYMTVLCELFKVPLRHLRIDTSKVTTGENELVDNALIWSVCYLIHRLGADLESIIFTDATYDASRLHAAVLQFATLKNISVQAITNPWCPTKDGKQMRYLKDVQTDVPTTTHELCTVHNAKQLCDVLASAYSENLAALTISSVYPTSSASEQKEKRFAFFSRYFERIQVTLQYLELRVAAFDRLHLELLGSACSRVPNVVVYETRPWSFSIQEIFDVLKKTENASENSLVFILQQQTFVHAIVNPTLLDELGTAFKFQLIPQENELRDDTMSQSLTF